MRVERGAEVERLVDAVDPLVAVLDVLDALARAAREELARHEARTVAVVGDDGERTEERAEKKRPGGDGDGDSLAPECRWNLARHQAREHRQDPRVVRRAVDVAIRAAGELIEIAEQLRVRGVRARAIEIGGRAAIELDQLVQLLARRIDVLDAREQRVELLPHRRAIGNEALDVHRSCLRLTLM